MSEKVWVDAQGARIVEAWKKRLAPDGSWEPNINDVLKAMHARVLESEAHKAPRRPGVG